MQMMKVFSFQGAISDSACTSDRHALFCTTLESSCTSQMFNNRPSGFLGLADYIEKVSNAFSDREVVGLINSIRKSNELLGVYEGLGDGLAEQLRKDSDFMRDLLANRVSSSLSGCLPKAYDTLADEGFGACLRFVSHFNSVFSENFDMLPVWAKTQTMALQRSNNLSHNFTIKSDGSGVHSDPGPDRATSTRFWFLVEGEDRPECSALPEQAIFLSARLRLVETMCSAFTSGRMPVLDPLEHADSSVAAFRHREYLKDGREAFDSLSGGLFLFARSMSEVSEPFVRCLRSSKVEKVYLSVFDGLTSPGTQELLEFLTATSKSSSTHHFDLACFDAESIWLESVV